MPENTRNNRLFVEITNEHKKYVETIINTIIQELTKRSKDHDISKFNKIEREGFSKMHDYLATNGSIEHRLILKMLKPTLDLHYSENRHHPEHFENGIRDMNLIDLIEMFVDWMATLHGKEEAYILRSIEKSKSRFKFDDILENIFKNTVNLIKIDENDQLTDKDKKDDL